MKSMLTLRIDEEIKEEAKTLVRERGKEEDRRAVSTAALKKHE